MAKNDMKEDVAKELLYLTKDLLRDHTSISQWLNSDINYILFMAVTPGVSGMSFDESVFEKIKTFREKYPEYSITIDGGINDKTAILTRPFIPDVLVSGSFILKEKNYGKQVFKLIGQDINL